MIDRGQSMRSPAKIIKVRLPYSSQKVLTKILYERCEIFAAMNLVIRGKAVSRIVLAERVFGMRCAWVGRAISGMTGRSAPHRISSAPAQ